MARILWCEGQQRLCVFGGGAGLAKAIECVVLHSFTSDGCNWQLSCRTKHWLPTATATAVACVPHVLSGINPREYYASAVQDPPTCASCRACACSSGVKAMNDMLTGAGPHTCHRQGDAKTLRKGPSCIAMLHALARGSPNKTWPQAQI
jgi:hypothetical protein